MSNVIKNNSLIRFYYSLYVILFVFSCTKEHKPATPVRLGGTYRIPYDDEITCLDPAICGERLTWIIGSQILKSVTIFQR
jgi:hypothetical protein